MHRGHRFRAAALGLAAVAALSLLATHRPGAPGGPDPDRDIVALASWAAWAIAGYLLFAVAAVAGQCARAPRHGGGRRLPVAAVVRAVVERCLGVTATAGIAVVVASAGAAPVAAATPAPPAPPSVVSFPSLDWDASGGLKMSTSSHPALPADASSAPLTVRRGDSLWRIATAELGTRATPARVAKRWPQWWLANRTVIGTDPGLIHPGQRLIPPASPPWRS